MKKKEWVIREILCSRLNKKTFEFRQKELAEKLGLSLSTVFNALKGLRSIKAIFVSTRNFRLVDFEKALYYWATIRNPEKDLVYKTRVDLAIKEIEASLPPGTIMGAYSAFRFHFKEAPADYDKVYVYSANWKRVKKRFPPQKGYPNLFVWGADPFLKSWGEITPLPQTFADLWNLPDWYAKEYQLGLKEKIDELLA